MMKRLDRKVTKADSQLEMYEAIAEYWIDISGNDGILRLNKMAHKKTQEFRDMCALLVRIMDNVHIASKSKK